MALEVFIEKTVSFLIEEGYRFFKIKPKKDIEGYTYLKVPPSYYGLSFITSLLGVTCLYFFIFHTKPAEFWYAFSATVFFVTFGILIFLYVKNTHFKFNDTEIIKQNLFKKTSIIFWNDCDFKKMHILTHEITIYNATTKMKVNVKFIGFNLLAKFIANKFLVSKTWLGA